MDWKEKLGEFKNTLIEREEVFGEAVRSGALIFRMHQMMKSRAT